MSAKYNNKSIELHDKLNVRNEWKNLFHPPGKNCNNRYLSMLNNNNKDNKNC